MSVLQYIGHIQKGVTTANAVKNDPFGLAFDTLVRIIVRYLIPIPFASELVIYFKGSILALLIGGVILFLTGIFIIMTTLLTPASAINSTIAGIIPFGQDLRIVVQALEGYIEEGFTDTDRPTKDPFGGTGESYSIRTATFHDLAYFQRFGQIHEGLDFVPSEAYYESNKAYQITNQPIVFATHTGNATTYTDSEGALTVAITNNHGTIQTVYKHFKQILACNCSVRAGQPIGIMGDTGFAFGEHLHYEVRINEGGTWVAVNPLNYIQ